MYTESSCLQVLPSIDKPFMIFYAKDDPISLVEDFPRDVLLSNPYCFLVDCEYGGHCSFMSKTDKKEEKYRRFFIDVVLKYLLDVEEFNK